MASVKKFIQPKLTFPIKSSSTSKSFPIASTRHHSRQASRDTQDLFNYERKRPRDLSPIYQTKKCKQKELPTWQLTITLTDEDFPVSFNFRCFNEETIFPRTVSESIKSERHTDDDCQTSDDDISKCCDYISFQLEQAILRAEINA